MFLLLIMIFFLTLSGCCPDKVNSHTDRKVIKQIMNMVDEGKFIYRYVLAFEIASTEIGKIYRVNSNTIPVEFGSDIYPYEIIKYKDKFICLSSPIANKTLSTKEICHKTNHLYIKDYNNEKEVIDRFFIGIKKNGRDYSIISANDENAPHYYSPYIPDHYPEMWEFLYEGFDENNPPKYILSFDIIWIYGDFNEDSIKLGYLQNEDLRPMGEIYCPNPEEYDRLKNDCFFATIKGKDTLKYQIKKIDYFLSLDAIPNPIFFKNIPQENSLDFLRELLLDSTYLFKKENGIIKRIPLLNSGIHRYLSLQKNEPNKILDILPPK